MNELNVPNIDVCLQIGQSCDYPNNLWTGMNIVSFSLLILQALISLPKRQVT